MHTIGGVSPARGRRGYWKEEVIEERQAMADPRQVTVREEYVTGGTSVA
jgi:hypothetical protein